MHRRVCLLLAAALCLPAAETPVLDFRDAAALRQVKARGAQVAPAADGRLRIACDTTQAWPGIDIVPASGTWDWTRFEQMEWDVRNVGTNEVSLVCRVDNAGADGSKHCNSQNLTLAPGAAGTVTIVFDRKPAKVLDVKLFGMRGYPPVFANDHQLDLARIVRVLLSFDHPRGANAIEIGAPRLSGEPRPSAASIPDAASFMPCIDTYGQYRHADWPGKTHGPDDLATARQAEAADLAARPGPPDWNRYGGWKGGPQLEATGAFRVAKHQGKWWLVDPEGRLFFSHGIDCLHHDVTTPIEERETWFQDFPGDQAAFKKLIGKGYALHGHYQGRTVRTFDFGSANLMRKYGEDWRNAATSIAHRRLRSWGMNTIANWSSKDYIRPADGSRTAYTCTSGFRSKVIAGSEGYWGQFKDVFDPDFTARAKAAFASIKEAADDPWCVGVYVDNELAWGDTTGLALGTLKSPPEQAAKQEMLKDLKAKYGDIAKLNTAWGTTHASWEALAASTMAPDKAKAKDDLEAFTARIADRYFAVVKAELKAVAPKLLYLGCRFAWANPLAVAAAVKHCDVVSYNLYRTSVAEFRLPVDADVPLIIGEFHFGALDRGMFHAGLVKARSQAHRAQMYHAYVEGALRHAQFVGTHWFQYRDEATTGRPLDEENYQIGFVDVADTPYPETIAACRATGYGMYALRAK